MSETLSLAVTSRSLSGRKSNQLRRQGQVPANVSDGKTATMVGVDPKTFLKVFAKVGESGLIYLQVEGEKEKRPAIITDAQFHPVDHHLVHVAFRQVSLKEKVTSQVQVELTGELGVRDAVAMVVRPTIEVSSLPLDIPEHFIVDISKFTEIGQMVTVAELPIDTSKVTLLVEADELNEPVVLVQQVKEEKVEEVVAPVAEEGTASAAGAEGTAGATAPAGGEGGDAGKAAAPAPDAQKK